MVLKASVEKLRPSTYANVQRCQGGNGDTKLPLCGNRWTLKLNYGNWRWCIIGHMCVLRGSFSASMLDFRSVALSLSLSLCVFSVAYACTFVDCRAGCQTDTLWHVAKIMQHLKTFERWPKLPIKKEVGKGLMILSLNLYIVLVWYYVHVYNGNSYAFDFFLWNSHRATAPVSRSMIF